MAVLKDTRTSGSLWKAKVGNAKDTSRTSRRRGGRESHGKGERH